jgi:hypothetical protein
VFRPCSSFRLATSPPTIRAPLLRPTRNPTYAGYAPSKSLYDEFVEAKRRPQEEDSRVPARSPEEPSASDSASSAPLNCPCRGGDVAIGSLALLGQVGLDRTLTATSAAEVLRRIVQEGIGHRSAPGTYVADGTSRSRIMRTWLSARGFGHIERTRQPFAASAIKCSCCNPAASIGPPSGARSIGVTPSETN